MDFMQNQDSLKKQGKTMWGHRKKMLALQLIF